MPGLSKIIPLLVALYTSVHLGYYRNIARKSWQFEEKIQKPYDFVIVGGGSSGSVLAKRLSENPRFHVLLLEAGSQENINTEIPMMCASYLQLTDVDWQFTTEPQTQACQGLQGQQDRWPRGKVLGGSGSINSMFYLRGHAPSYNYWKSLGNTGWGWDDVLPYFKKSEDNKNPSFAADTEHHNTGGELTVSDIPYHKPLMDAFLQSATAKGYRIIDLNSNHTIGFGPLQGTLRDGARCSPAKAFLNPASWQPNLDILLNSTALRVLFEGNRAVGVEFERNGKIYVAKAAKEIILSAGSINSPKLLMLSGIGPKEDLKKHSIHVTTDFPGVGKNLQDHYSTGGLVWTIKTNDSFIESEIESPNSMLEWLVERKGPLTNVGTAEAVGLIKTSTDNNPDPNWATCEIIFFSGSTLTDSGKYTRYSFNYDNKTWNQYYAPFTSYPTYWILPMLLRPQSRGYITLRSANPKDKPIIQPNFLSHPQDMRDMLSCLKTIVQLGNSSYFEKFGSSFIATTQPGCEAHPKHSDAYYECLIRHQTTTGYHPIGTNKMGPKTDPLAVVDPGGRVYKVKNLRISDMSIAPHQITGHTNAVAIMIGERIADMIKAAWKDDDNDGLKNCMHTTNNFY